MDENLKKDVELEVRRLFSADQEKHREYIEKQINTLKWVASLIAVIVFGTFSFFFGKTYSNLEEKIDATVNKIQTDYRIDQKVQKRVNDYISISIGDAVSQIDTIISANIPILVDKIEPEIEIKINQVFEKYEGEKLKTIINEKLKKIESTKIPDVLIPSGTIVAWNQSKIPIGWVICDGNNGTPNLKNKFIYGATSISDINQIGGASSHKHEIIIPTTPSSDNSFNKSDIHGITTKYTKQEEVKYMSNASSNIPPFIKLLYIMKE